MDLLRQILSGAKNKVDNVALGAAKNLGLTLPAAPKWTPAQQAFANSQVQGHTLPSSPAFQQATSPASEAAWMAQYAPMPVHQVQSPSLSVGTTPTSQRGSLDYMPQDASFAPQGNYASIQGAGDVDQPAWGQGSFVTPGLLQTLIGR